MDNIVVNNKLEGLMLEIFRGVVSDYDSIEQFKNEFYNGNISPSNGDIPELVYYYQTNEIYRNHFEEVNDILRESDISSHNITDILSPHYCVCLVYTILVTRWIDKIA